MKQLLVLLATVALGVIIVDLIIGPSPDSTYNVVKHLWETEIQARSLAGTNLL